MDELGGLHDHDMPNTNYTMISALRASNGSLHTTHGALKGGRTPITSEAMVTDNNLRNFQGRGAMDLATIDRWVCDNEMTNNQHAWGDNLKGVGLWHDALSSQALRII